MQTVTPGSKKITDTSVTKGFGEHNLWELWLLDKAEEIPCGSIRTFLNYLFSGGTKHCEIRIASPLAIGFVDITLRGPLADEGCNHFLSYRLTPSNVRRLTEAEKDLLVSRLIKHYSSTDNKPDQKVRQALTAVGISS
jgi:hypothetical protein